MAAQAQLEEVLHQAPQRYGLVRTRWRLQDLRVAVSWLARRSVPGISRLLWRLGFSRQQVQRFVRSPDPDYAAKRRAVVQAFTQAVNYPGTVELVFLDEVTYYRLPDKAPVYHRTATAQPRLAGAARANTQTRVVAALNGYTGQVTYLQRSCIGEQALRTFYQHLRHAYPKAQTIYVVQDNWPTHKLPTVLAELATQRCTPLFLPTYASWLNPIEKLWRWLRQTVLHAHPYAEALDTLRQQVFAWLDQFATASDTLLRYVGLLLD